MAVAGILIVVVIIGAVAGSPKGKPASSRSTPTPTPSLTFSSPTASPTPTLSADEAKFVQAIRSALASDNSTNDATDAQIAAIGEQLCTALKDGASQSSVISASHGVPARFSLSPKHFVRLAERDLCHKYLPKPPRVIARFNGAGTQNTPSFTVPAQWHLSWAYWGCSGGSGNFAVTEANTDGSDDLNGVTVNELGSGRGPVRPGSVRSSV